jgi:uncharacterized membrane protein
MDVRRDPYSTQVLKYSLPARARVAPGMNVGKWDRVFAASAAVAAAALGARRRGWLRVPLLGVSAELFRRAATGHCYLYSTLGISTAGLSRQHLSKSFDDQMDGHLAPLPYPIKRTVTINKPRTDVYLRFQHLNSLLREVGEIQDMRQSSKELQFWFVPDDGAPARVRFTVDHEEQERYAFWRCHIDGLHMASGVLSFAEAPGNRGTEVAVAFDLTKTTFGGYRYIAGVLESLVDRADNLTRHYLRTVKQIVETGHVVNARMRPPKRNHESRLPEQTNRVDRRTNQPLSPAS